MQEDKPELFATTRWTVVLAAAGGAGLDKDAALAALCADYWKPVYAYVRQRAPDRDTARDLTQEFFAHLLEKDLLSGITREGGGFRAFLLTMVRRFLVSEYRRETTERRGGHVIHLPLDSRDLPEPASPHETPEQAFDRRWALTVLDRATTRLREETTGAGKGALFAALAPFLSTEPDPGTYAALAPRLGMSSAAITMAVLRLRRRFRDLVHREIAETLAHPAQADAEMKELLAALRGGNG